jgi:hypothetical protein
MAGDALYNDNPAMEFVDREKLIHRYAHGYAAVTSALTGIAPAELDRRPAADSWTPREIVHHLADSETNSYVRLRRLIAEDHPVIVGYEETIWADRLYYDGEIDAPLAVLKAVREASSQLLGRLSADEWQREGTHTESGRYSVSRWLEIYANHAHDHAGQIVRARKGVA